MVTSKKPTRQATLQRLQMLELPAAKRGRVFVIPRPLSIEEWQARAEASQEALFRATQDSPGLSVAGVAAMPDCDLADMTANYKPDPARHKDAQ